MAGWFEIRKSTDGQFWFILVAGNGEIILQSELYKAKASAQNGIDSVRSNCAMDGRYERNISKDNRHYFNLKAVNNQIIGTSQMYSSAQAREVGIASVKANGTVHTIKDLT